MPTTRTRLRAALPAALAATLLAACASTQPAAAPATRSPTPAGATTGAEPSSFPTAASTATTDAQPSSTPTAVLGPTGYGTLRLGMSVARAEATGLITTLASQPAGGCNSSGHLLGTPVNAPDQQGTLFFSDHLGLAAIAAYPGVATPRGIAIGSTSKQVKAAYPDWRTFPETGGRGYAKASPTSVYRIVVAPATGRVTELTLQLTNQDCYE